MSALNRHFWLMVLGLSTAAAMLAIPGVAAAQSQPIQVCVNRQGRVVGVDVPCKYNQVSLTWNIQGPQGAAGPVGDQGATGPTGNQGPVGPQGPVGTAGSVGPTGALGPAGPAGPPGIAGAQGAQGLQGPQGPTGPTGPAGPAGNPGAAGLTGDNLVTLAGNSFSYLTGVENGLDLYLGAGNGVAGVEPAALTSESTPLPAGVLSNLTVLVGTAPGIGNTDTFNVCVNSVCSATVQCVVQNSSQTCTSTGTLSINDGDRVAIHSIGSAIAIPATVTWSMNLQLAP